MKLIEKTIKLLKKDPNTTNKELRKSLKIMDPGIFAKARKSLGIIKRKNFLAKIHTNNSINYDAIKAKLINSLPEKFTRKEAKEVGAKIGLSAVSVDRFLLNFPGVLRSGHGKYERVGLKNSIRKEREKSDQSIPIDRIWTVRDMFLLGDEVKGSRMFFISKLNELHEKGITPLKAVELANPSAIEIREEVVQ